MLSTHTISGLPSPSMSTMEWRSIHSPARRRMTWRVKLPSPSFSNQNSPTFVSQTTRSMLPLPVRSAADTA